MRSVGETASGSVRQMISTDTLSMNVFVSCKRGYNTSQEIPRCAVNNVLARQQA